MIHVKICGLQRPGDALVAIEAGADLLGLVFAPSRRQVNVEQARAVAEAVAGRAPLVGVFVNAAPEEMNRLGREVGLSYLQLSGHEPDERIAALDFPTIQVIHMDETLPAGDLAQRIERTPAELVLLDTAAQGAYGGTGRAFDWSRLPAASRPILLAGGLHPGNVAAAARMGVWGVDVSSGVETDGVKDPEKIRAFLAAARLK